MLCLLYTSLAGFNLQNNFQGKRTVKGEEGEVTLDSQSSTNFEMCIRDSLLIVKSDESCVLFIECLLIGIL